MPFDAAQMKRMQMLVSLGQESVSLTGPRGRERHVHVSVTRKSDFLQGEARQWSKMRSKERGAGVEEFSLTLCYDPQSSINDATSVFRSVQEDGGEKPTCSVSHLCVRSFSRRSPMWSL